MATLAPTMGSGWRRGRVPHFYLIAYCSGLVQGLVFSRIATTFAGAIRKVGRHALAPPVSNAFVSAMFPQVDLGAVCP